jgi:hypothetical protein
MSNKLGMEPMFPLEELQRNINDTGVSQMVYHKGMSKRIYIACAAMQGILSSQIIMEAAIRVGEKTNTGTDYAVCKMAYEFADELLKQGQDNSE